MLQKDTQGLEAYLWQNVVPLTVLRFTYLEIQLNVVHWSIYFSKILLEKRKIVVEMN